MFELVFELESPLHIGFLPSKGSVVASTRRYVPGRNFWGALTKRVAEHLYRHPDGKNYGETGQEVRTNFRFSYFYVFDGETVYHPRYGEEGLTYGNKINIPASEFDLRFIGSRAVTAIDGETGAAKNESLHEIEFIKHIYKDSRGNIKNTRITGAIWMKDSVQFPSESGKKQIEFKDDGIYADGCNLLTGLIIGGEQNYGFGRIKLCEIKEGKEGRLPLEFEEDGEVRIKVEKDRPVLSHVLINDKLIDQIMFFKGDIELISGRGYIKEKQDSEEKTQNPRAEERFKDPGREILKPEYYFSPGTVINDVEQKLMLKNDGTLCCL